MATLGSILVSIGVDMTDFTRSMGQVETQMKKFGDKATKLGKAMLPVSAGMTAAFAVGAKGALEASDSTTHLQNALGVTATEAQKLAELAKDVYKEGFGESLPQVTADLATMVQAIGNVNEPIDELVAGAEKIGKTFGTDVPEVTKTVSTMMKQFGISAEEAMDIVTVGFQKGGNKAGDFLDTLNEYSPQFKAVGYSADEMLNKLILGTKAGAHNMDKVGDSVKEFNIRLKDGSKASSDALKDLGLNADDVSAKIAQGGATGKKAFDEIWQKIADIQEPAERTRIGVALMGTQFEDLESDVIVAMASSEDAIGKVGGAMDELVNNKSMSEQFAGMFRSVLSTLAPLGEALLKLSQTYLPPIVAGIKMLSGWFTGLSQPVQAIIIGLAGLIAVIAPLLIVVGSLVSAFSALAPLFAIVGTAIAGISAPVLIAIGAIVALIAIGILVYKNWDSISASLTKLWVGIKDVASKVFTSIVEFFKKWGITILAVISGPIGILALLIYKNWDGIKAKTIAIWNAISGFVSGVASAIWNNVSSKFTAVASTVTNIFNGIKKTISNIMDSAKNIVSNAINKIAGFFSGANFKLPHIKLPHFSISGKFSLNPPQMPKLGVNWYKSGGVFNGASTIGVGEAGAEAVVPLTGHRMKPFAMAIADNMSNGGNGSGGVTNTFNLYGLTVREEADVDKIADQLLRKQIQRTRSLGLL